MTKGIYAAYFVGGELDLTKKVIREDLREILFYSSESIKLRPIEYDVRDSTAILPKILTYRLVSRIPHNRLVYEFYKEEQNITEDSQVS